LRLEGEERLVWIDAICVNQGALDERSHQVQLMKDIYSQAVRVIVWLGEDEYGLARKAIELIEIAANRCCAIFGKSLEDIEFRDISSNPALAEMLHKDEFEEWEWDAVVWFYRNTWFTRVWIIQEVAYAPAVIYMGVHETTWLSVGIGAKIFAAHDCARNIIERITYGRGASIFFMRFSFNLAPWVLLRESAHSEATDPRDKVFAILGFLDEQARNSEFLQPDYTKDISNVFVDVVRYIIGREDGEKALSDVFSFFPDAAIDPNEAVPSWVPRWDLGIDKFAAGQPHWNAGGASVQNGAEITDNRVLCLKGIKICVPKFTTVGLCTQERSLVHDVARISSLLDFVHQHSSSSGTKEAIQEAFARTLTLGRLGVIDLLEFLSIERRRLEGDNIERASNFHQEITFSKEFFFADDYYMGLGPKAIEPGDVVCIVYGHKMPFVLRPTETQYKYVGACYLDGFMNGEAIEKFKEGELREEWFQLQ
jgi:hypothetical protein